MVSVSGGRTVGGVLLDDAERRFEAENTFFRLHGGDDT